MFKELINWFSLLLLILSFHFFSCREIRQEGITERHEPTDTHYGAAIDTAGIPFGINELLPGDIIVRANNNWLPGSAFVPGGYSFGHAAIVIRGARHPDPDTLLASVLVMESNSRDVAPEQQVRIVPGYYVDPDPDLSNLSFGPKYAGIRYRLRMPLTPVERDSLIAFLLRQDPCNSSWRAIKDEGRGMKDEGRGSRDEGRGTKDEGRGSSSEQRNWYCTLIIRGAFLHVKGIDLDANRGWVVYPNDVIASPWFDNRPGEAKRRVRF